MSRFNRLMEGHLNNTGLVRIRVRHDPKNKQGELNEYVGYVLEEDGAGNVVAIVPSMGPDTMSFGPDQYSHDTPCGSPPDPLANFKKHVVEYLMTRGYHDKVSENMENIINASDPVELERLVQACGCDTTAIINMYREFVAG